MIEFKDLIRGKLVDVNPRAERHGETLVSALDLRLQVDTNCNALRLFDDGLLGALYVAAKQRPLLDPVAEATDLRFPDLGMPLKWAAEGSGYTLEIDYGLGDQSNMTLHDCTLHKHSIEAKQGGGVTLTFTVSCANGLDEEHVGRLAMHVQQDLQFRLLAPTAQAKAAA